VVEEFNEIVDAFGLRDWDSYRDVRRLGRKSRLNEAKRRLLWDGFAAVLQELESSGQITPQVSSSTAVAAARISTLWLTNARTSPPPSSVSWPH
jgi:hypothetical protein